MKIGIYLTNQQHLDVDMVGALADQIAMVHAARDNGWDTFMAGQHYLNEGNNKQLELVPYLARLMAEGGEMTAGMGVFLLPLHSPVYVAETVATLDVIAGGKFVFGVGMGYRDVEFDAFGVSKKSRVRRFEDALDIVKRLWKGEAVSHDSDLCKLDNAVLNTRPVQQPHPPIWIAASHPNAVRRAARMGDSWFVNPLDDLGTLRGQVALYREELERSGKPFPDDFAMMREIFVARDRKTAFEVAGPWLKGKYADYARWGAGEEASEVDLEKLAKDRFFIGSPEECYEQMRPFREELGINHFLLRTHWAGMPVSDSLASMKMISDELLPSLRKL